MIIWYDKYSINIANIANIANTVNTANICDNLIRKISNNKSQLNKVITDQLDLLMTDYKELLKLFLL